MIPSFYRLLRVIANTSEHSTRDPSRPIIKLVPIARRPKEKPSVKPFSDYSVVEVSPNERSPFANLACDQLHYLFIKHLCLVDIVAAAEASYHINRFAERFIFPRCKILSINEVDIYGPYRSPTYSSPESLRVCQLQRILNKVGPYLERIEFIVDINEEISDETQTELVQSVLMGCPNLQILQLDRVNLKDVKRNFRTDRLRLALPELELLHYCRGTEPLLGMCRSLRSLSFIFTHIYCITLAEILFKNSATLGRLKIKESVYFESDGQQEYFMSNFTSRLPKLIDITTDLNPTDMVKYFGGGNFTRIEINGPLIDDNWQSIRPLGTFENLRRLAICYSFRDVFFENINYRHLKGFFALEHLEELHFIISDGAGIYHVMSKLPPVNSERHLHVFVYSRPLICHDHDEPHAKCERWSECTRVTYGLKWED